MCLVGQLREPRGQHLQRRLDIVAGAVRDQVAKQCDLVLDMALQDLDQQIILAGEVRLEGALRMPCGAADVANRHGRDPLLDNRGMRGRDQPVPRLALRVLARKRHGFVLQPTGETCETFSEVPRSQ